MLFGSRLYVCLIVSIATVDLVLSKPPTKIKIKFQKSFNLKSICFELVKILRDEADSALLVVKEIVPKGSEPKIHAANGLIVLKIAKTSQKMLLLQREWNIYNYVGTPNKRAHEGLAIPYFSGEMMAYGHTKIKVDNFAVFGLEHFDTDLQQFREDLDTHIEKELQGPYLIEIGRRLFEVLDFLKINNIVHRDIKPSNILLNLRNPNIIVHIDFGIAAHEGNVPTYYPFGPAIYYMTIHIFIKDRSPSINDDAENGGYVFIDLFAKSLPWETNDVKDKQSILSSFIFSKFEGNFSGIALPLNTLLSRVRAQLDGSPVVDYAPVITKLVELEAKLEAICGFAGTRSLKNFLANIEREADSRTTLAASSTSNKLGTGSRSGSIAKILGKAFGFTGTHEPEPLVET